MTSTRRPIAAALFALTLAAPVSAQAVLVRVSDAETAQPLQGALVVLSSPAGAHVRSALADARGRFLFTGIDAGAYTLRAELIGYATATRTAVTVAAGETAVVEIPLSGRAIELEGISVEGEGRCTVRPGEGLRVAEVWDEARKALEAARWTEEQRAYEYRTRKYVRDVEETTGRVVRQSTDRGRVFTDAPYESRPADDLIENGFVQPPPDGEEGDLYFAPDASVLLSDAFLDTHCLRLRAGKDRWAGSLGLDFEPVRGRRIPDIAGTLWIDPDTWRLEHLEFRYENLRSDLELRGIGGEVAFRGLPNGTWVVPEWKIRMPWLARGQDFQGRQRIYQHGYREEGGSVLFAREPATGEVVLSASTATLEGVVLEELSGEPVRGAGVSLVGTEERATTDAEGRFRLSEIVPGVYDVAFTHPTMDAYGFDPEPVATELEAGEVESVRLRLPSPFALQAAACREELDTRPEDSAILVGQVTDRGSGQPLEGAEVRIEWDEFRFSGWTPGDERGGFDFRLSESGQGVLSTTDVEGRFRACVVPANTRLTVTASWGPFQTQPDTIRIPEGAPAMGHDVRIALAGTTSVVGTVEGWRAGEPVAGAEVRLTPLAPNAEARTVATDAEGRFTLPDAEVGGYAVEVRSLGYASVTDTIEARSGRTNLVRVRMPEEALEIEGVTVEVEARIPRLDLSGFYQRRREGLGVFIDADDIAARGTVANASELLDRTSGVKVRYTSANAGGHAAIVTGRGCLPAIYIDGTLARPAQPFVQNPNPTRTRNRRVPDYLDELVGVSDIAGLEVYRSPAEMPAQYTGTGSQCGVVLVWTR